MSALSSRCRSRLLRRGIHQLLLLLLLMLLLMLLLLLRFGARLGNMLNFLIACDGDNLIIEQIVGATSLREFVDGNSLIGHFVERGIGLNLSVGFGLSKKQVQYAG